MTTIDKIRGEKLRCSIKRETALSSGEIDNSEYLTGDEILPSVQNIIRRQANYTYSSLEKAF